MPKDTTVKVKFSTSETLDDLKKTLKKDSKDLVIRELISLAGFKVKGDQSND